MAHVPSLMGSLFLTDPQSIIAYTYNKFARTPKEAVPLMDDYIISLPALAAKYGKDPDNLVENIRTDLQSCFDRIFAGEREVKVASTYTAGENGDIDVTISIYYTLGSGEISQTGTTISLDKDGRLVIPEYKLQWSAL